MVVALGACGAEITRVQAIDPGTGVFPADENFRVGVVLVCPSTCFEFDIQDAECNVDVDAEVREVRFEASLPIEDTGDDCFEQGCPGLTGITVFCSVPPLDAGEWTFRAGEGANQIREEVDLR